MSTYEVHVSAKPPRSRGQTWTDEEVRKLFLVWSLPDINKGFQSEKRKRDMFHLVSAELAKLGVTRTWAECKAKIKNLKGEYRKARDANAPHTFKFFKLMEKVLDDKVPTGESATNQKANHAERYEVIPAHEVGFPVVLENVSRQEKVMVPSTIKTARVQGSRTSQKSPPQQSSSTVTQGENEVRAVDAESGEEVIVIATTKQQLADTSHCIMTEANFVQVDQMSSSSKTHQPSSSRKRTQALSNAELNQKRKKLHHLSEKMAETVERILTKTTETLLEEFKASEERFIEWEERKRLEEQKREEKLLQSFVDALKQKSSDDESREQREAQKDKESEERRRIMNMIQASDDPCAVTFDLLATRLTNTLTDQQKELEQSLFQWETKMQKKEMKHTENVFNMILSAVKAQANEDSN